MVSRHPHSSVTCFGHLPCQDVQLCPIFLHSLHRIPDRVIPQRIWPLSLLHAWRKLLAFSSSYTNAVVWLPLHTCVWAHACKFVEGRVLDLGLLVPMVFTVYILGDTPRRPPENGFADSYSLKEGTRAQFLCIQPKLDIINLSNFYQSVGWSFLFFQPSGSFALPSTCSSQASSCWQPKAICWRRNKVKAKKCISFQWGGVFTWVNMVRAKCLIGLKGEEARFKKPPNMVVCLNPCAPMHYLVHCTQLYCVMCSPDHLCPQEWAGIDSMPGAVVGMEDTT